ncbi:MAG TPA: glycosyltransferase [Terriglobia bacterium]|nr:glycosyltransferase [Terriglobia bacterium]
MKFVIEALGLTSGGGRAGTLRLLPALARHGEHSFVALLADLPEFAGLERPNLRTILQKKPSSLVAREIYLQRTVPRICEREGADALLCLGNFGPRSSAVPTVVMLHNPHYVAIDASAGINLTVRERLVTLYGQKYLRRIPKGVRLVVQTDLMKRRVFEVAAVPPSRVVVIRDADALPPETEGMEGGSRAELQGKPTRIAYCSDSSEKGRGFQPRRGAIGQSWALAPEAALKWLQRLKTPRFPSPDGGAESLALPTCQVCHGIGQSSGGEVAQQFAGARSPFTFLCLAQYYPHKNLEVLVEAMKRLPSFTRRPVRCLLTIQPDQHRGARRLLRRIAHERLDNVLVNIGPVTGARLGDVYRSADAFVLPTLLESFGRTYLEAMRFGLPIVTSDRDFARHLCGEAALYFDPLDAASVARNMARIAEDRELAARLIAEGRSIVQRVPAWEEIAAQFVAVLEEAGREGCDRVPGRVDHRAVAAVSSPPTPPNGGDGDVAATVRGFHTHSSARPYQI